MNMRRHAKRTSTRYLIEVPHEPDECAWVMEEVIGRGPQYPQMFWWSCLTGEHIAWAFLEGPGREAVLEEALPPTLRARALVHRLTHADGRAVLDRLADEVGG
jgi:hypothetical protein